MLVEIEIPAGSTVQVVPLKDGKVAIVTSIVLAADTAKAMAWDMTTAVWAGAAYDN